MNVRCLHHRAGFNVTKVMGHFWIDSILWASRDEKGIFTSFQNRTDRTHYKLCTYAIFSVKKHHHLMICKTQLWIYGFRSFLLLLSPLVNRVLNFQVLTLIAKFNIDTLYLLNVSKAILFVIGKFRHFTTIYEIVLEFILPCNFIIDEI